MYRVVLIVFITFQNKLVLSNGSETNDCFPAIIESLGYSPECVTNSLKSCDRIKKPDFSKDILETLTEVKFAVQQTLIENKRPRNCAELRDHGDLASGVRTVYPYDCCRDRPVTVFCDQTTDEGGWTVFQNRAAMPMREDFFRSWVEYEIGFGNISGEFWLGLKNIHALVSSTLMEMRIDLEDYEGETRWAKYGMFYVGDTLSNYALSIKKFSGDAGDALALSATKVGADGMKFTTYDRDNDLSGENCAVLYRGAWWYNACHVSNLNGFQYVGKHSTFADGINWHPFHQYNYSLKKNSMKIRPSFMN